MTCKTKLPVLFLALAVLSAGWAQASGPPSQFGIDAPELARLGTFSVGIRTVALVRFPDGREVVGDGVVDGTIADAPRGDNGFGYDPVFVPDEGDGRTFAELTPDEKHAISHRGRAVRALAESLAEL